jgi:hypothetical protein
VEADSEPAPVTQAGEPSAQTPFRPTRIALIRDEREAKIVAIDDNTDAYAGVVCPPGAIDCLESFVPSNELSLLTIWRSYEASKGAGPFFWDIINIALGLEMLSDVPGVRSLLRFQTAAELCHNSWQARLMGIAANRGLNPKLIPAESQRRRADFCLSTGLQVEIKTLFSEAGIEIQGKGFRLSPPDADRFAQSIRRKVADAGGQVGKLGCVVVATWCDLTANFILAFPGIRRIEDVEITPGSMLLALEPSNGDLAQVGLIVPIQEIDAFCGQVAEHLKADQRIPIPFSGRYVMNCRGQGPMSSGRTIRIGSFAIVYADYELCSATFQREAFSDGDELSLLMVVRDLNIARERFREANDVAPLRPGSYTADQLATDERFRTFFEWARLLSRVLLLLESRRVLGDLLPPGRPREDAQKFCRAALGAEGPVVGLAGLQDGFAMIERLTKHIVSTVIAKAA